jgi:hypothetical protein
MRPCTEIGCRSPLAVITGRIALPAVPLGAHRFDIEAGGVSQSCTVVYTSNASSIQATCTGDGELFFGPATRNVEDTSAVPGVVGVRIEAIPGEYTWQLTLTGSPASVRVTHVLDGRELAQRSSALVYTENRPNGPGCEPLCQQASLTWDFSP